MKDNYVVPSSYPGGRHLCMLAYPPAKVQDGPSSAMSVSKKKEDHTSPPAVCLFKGDLYTWKEGQSSGRHFHCCTEGIKSIFSNNLFD